MLISKLVEMIILADSNFGIIYSEVKINCLHSKIFGMFAAMSWSPGSGESSPSRPEPADFVVVGRCGLTMMVAHSVRY